MPDFDQFERKLRDALVKISKEVRPLSKKAFLKHAESLCAEPNANRPCLFKEKSSVDLEEYLSRAESFFTKIFPKGYCFFTSQNNRFGKDLTEINSGTEIEIKTGTAKTDANLGLSTIAYILSASPSETDVIKRILKNGIKERRANHFNTEFINNSKHRTSIAMKDWLDKCVKEINLDLGKREHLVKMFSKIAKGITKLPDLKLTNSPKILLLECDWENGFRLYQYDVPADGALSKITVILTDKNRVQLCATVNEVPFIIYLHYRNSYHGKGEGRIPAEAWVSTASFQCWIGR